MLIFAWCLTTASFATDDTPCGNIPAEQNNMLDELQSYFDAAYTVSDVLDCYDELINTLDLIYKSDGISMTNYKNAVEDLQFYRTSRLDELNIPYYTLNKDNVEEVESELLTDFSQMGINFDGENKNATFLITLEGTTEISDIDTQSTISSTTSYTYNGTTYYLRMLTLTATDYSSYKKSSTTDLLTSKTKTFVQSLLNAALERVISSASSVLGNIYSLLGLDISDYGAQDDGTYINASFGASWRRVYRQVWTSSNTWQSGSCVECAVCTYALQSYLYNSSSNKYVTSSASDSYTKYSSYYYNTDWQKENAVKGYLNGTIYYDKTGNVSYTVKGSTVATLSEPAA